MKKGNMFGRQVFCALSFAVAWAAVSSAAEDVWHWRAERKGSSYYLVSYPENWTNETESITGTPPRGARVVPASVLPAERGVIPSTKEGFPI